MIPSYRENLQSFTPGEMVRLTGKSVLYFPPEHCHRPLVVPTCIKAMAQYLVKNSGTRGVFRVSGSIKGVNSLFDYYFALGDSIVGEVDSTVRCSSLPEHIPFTAHDVASTFKRILSVLPGGVLGSIQLFNALKSISDTFEDPADPAIDINKEPRARLIALALATIESSTRRELAYAVFSLLSVIGKTAQSPLKKEPQSGSLGSELMGYQALGIVFGPLLLMDLLDKLGKEDSATSHSPLHPGRILNFGNRASRKPLDSDEDANGHAAVRNVCAINKVAEMIISNWSHIVLHLESIEAAYPQPDFPLGSRGHPFPGHGSRESHNRGNERAEYRQDAPRQIWRTDESSSSGKPGPELDDL